VSNKRIEIISKSNSFFGLKYNKFNKSDLVLYIKYIINEEKKSIIYGYSLVLLPKLKQYPDIYKLSESFDFHVVDGHGLYTVMKLFNVRNIADYSLPDIVNIALEIAEDNKFSVLLLGATKEINFRACENIKIKYPNIRVKNGIDGYFNRDYTDEILERIHNDNPDVLLIGITSPEKEKVAALIKKRVNCKIIIPCGGVIDILGGKSKREPIIVKKLNLTWLYRFLQEPCRLFNSILINGFKVIILLIPVMFIYYFVLRNKSFSIPKFYGLK